MSWRQQEAVIREKRTILATKNNYMGPTGKLGVIAKYLGKPIIRQGGSLYEPFLEDPYKDTSNEEYETTLSGQEGPLMYRDEIAQSGDEFMDLEGYVFDGLSSGVHMEIAYWTTGSRIVATYKGYEVYREDAAELEAYAPAPEWENYVEKLYQIAKKRMKSSKAQEEEMMTIGVERMQKTFLQRLKSLWGYTE